MIFSVCEPIAITLYKLVTANDTKNNSGRNWKTWKIYGGNFASSEAVEKDAEGWVLLDEKTYIGKDQLPAANFATAFFQLSKPSATQYQYFKVEVEALVSGTTQQMAEFAFGNYSNRIL